MKKLLSAICVFSLLSIYPQAYGAIKVSEGTRITISPIEKITSKNQENTYSAMIKEDVKVNNTIVFREGDKAEINVVKAEKARCWGKPGTLVVTNGYVYDTLGKKHRVSFTRAYYGQEKEWVTPTAWVGFAFFIVPIFIAFVHGGQEHIRLLHCIHIGYYLQNREP